LNIEIEVPIRADVTLNSRLHWAEKARKVRDQRHATGWMLKQHKAPGLPAVVTLTRIGPRRLDGDNCQGALKGPRDAVADWLGVDDKDERIDWRYEQVTGRYAVRITVEAAA